jgi:four helix bundle protein
MAYKHFTDMLVWQKGHKAGLLVYERTSRFPDVEKYALTSQMRRAVVSITSNIAEAFGRQGGNDKARFYLIARGSCFEIQSQGHVARDVGYLGADAFVNLNGTLASIIYDLNKIIKTLASRP